MCNPEAIHLASVLLIGSLFAQSLVRPRVKSQEGCIYIIYIDIYMYDLEPLAPILITL